MTENPEIKINGRIIKDEDIKEIQEIVKLYPKLGYQELVKTVCVNLRWASIVNTKKEKDVEHLLKYLEEKGYMKLPIRTEKKKEGCSSSNKSFYRRKEIVITERTSPLEDVCGIINDFFPVEIELVNNIEKESLWNEYVERYHELKYGSPFGDRLKYFIKIGGEKPQYAGCIIFSASSWALQERDKWIGWTKEDRTARLHLVVNNTRLLIFPWIKVRNLASLALSGVTKRICLDWQENFKYRPVLLETFVDVLKYRGTCYKAANWTHLGNTKGRGRQDVSHKNLSSPKAIFMYPLIKDFRDYLTGKKAGGDSK